jgi:hypothetical protein
VIGSKPKAPEALRPHGMINSAWRWGAGVISAGAGLVSILSYTHSIKAKFDSDSLSASALSPVRWVGITPAMDTAASIGDTIHLAVTATDSRGNALLGASTVWSSTDSLVASVDSAGTVVARGGGATGITVTVGSKVAQAHVYVQQRPAGVEIVSDSIFRVPEGERGRILAHVVDGRGHEIFGLVAKWRPGDPSIAAVDSLGGATGVAPGRTSFTATYDGMVAQLPVEVYPVPASLTVLGGDAQKAPAGRRVSQLVMVQVVSRSGRPIEGVPVRFVLDESAGHTDPDVDSSDSQGIARASWTLGSSPGRQTLAITAQGVASSTVIAAEAEPVAANTRITVVSESLEGPGGSALEKPVTVRVTDSSGVALADVPVSWSAADGGSVVASESRTDSLGESQAHWTLGPKSGDQQAYVQVGSPRSVPRFSLTATALPGAAVSLVVINGKKYEGPVGSVLKSPLELRVADRAGNPVAGVPVQLSPTSGTVVDSAPVTDSTGRVQVAWTLGRTTGPQRLSARVEGVPRSVEIAARARAASPANLAFAAPKPGTANRAIQSLDVDLTDAYGNPVVDQAVVFSTKFGSVSPSRVMTDGRGRAHTRWTPGSKTGRRTLLAAVKGTDARAEFVLEPPPAPAVTKAAVQPKAASPAKAAAPAKKASVKRVSR